MRTWLFAALLGVLGVQTSVTSQQPNQGVIEVTVRDSLTKAPVPGARVRFMTYRTFPDYSLTDVTADENGRAVFKDLAPGNYSVDAQQEGYVHTFVLFAPTLTLTDTKRKIEYETLLTRGAIVKGRVLGPDGNPLAKAAVSLRVLTWFQGRRGLSTGSVGRSSGLTDDRGEYSISAVPTGEYFLRVELSPQSTNGQFSSVFDNLSRITYYPGVSDALTATRINVTAGQEQGGLDIKIPNLKVYRITGTVLNLLPAAAPATNGRPITRGPSSFFIGSTDPDALEDPVQIPSRSEPTANPDEFTFEIGGLIPGSYYLYPLYGNTLNPVSTRALVTVKDQNIENLHLWVEPFPAIKGHVTIRGDTSSFNWRNATLGLRSVDRLPLLLQGRGPDAGSTVVDSKTGEFVISAFEKGVKFTLSLPGFPPDSYIADLRQGGRNLSSDGIVISDPGEGAIEVTIAQQGGTVEGTVVRPTGEPQEGAVIALVPALSMRGNAMRYSRGVGNELGKFTIRGIAPGEYKAFAWEGLAGTVAERNAEFLAPIESKGIAVTIRAGSSQTLQLKALPNP